MVLDVPLGEAYRGSWHDHLRHYIRDCRALCPDPHRVYRFDRAPPLLVSRAILLEPLKHAAAPIFHFDGPNYS
jgi:hypothetical protein